MTVTETDSVVFASWQQHGGLRPPIASNKRRDYVVFARWRRFEFSGCFYEDLVPPLMAATETVDVDEMETTDSVENSLTDESGILLQHQQQQQQQQLLLQLDRRV